MKHPEPVDYQAALDAFRRDEHKPDNPVGGSAAPVPPPLAGGAVDYIAASRAWTRHLAGKYTIYTEEHEDEGRL